jgi:hypothetical protein
LRAFAQIRLVQKIGNQGIVETFFGLARDVGKYPVARFRGFGDNADAF